MTKRPSLAEKMKAFAESPPPEQPAPPAPSNPPASPQPVPKGRAKSREGMKLLLTPLEPSIHKRLKMLAVKEDSTIESMVRGAIEDLLRKHGG